MSREFALLKASRELENYLSRERYTLDKMQDNDRITTDFFESKVKHYNHLVNTLNDLFATMIGSTNPKERLFVLYQTADALDVEVDVPVSVNHVDKPPETHGDEPVEPDEPVPEEEEEPDDMPDWQREGYPSYNDWLVAKERESIEQPDDLDVSVNAGLSEHRMTKALQEYNESVEEDISEYNPDEDTPVSVLDTDPVSDLAVDDDGLTEDLYVSRPTENVDYLTHTADDTRIDRDPTQIVDVQTAVERDGEKSRRGVDIDVKSYTKLARDTTISGILDDELDKLLGKTTQPVETSQVDDDDVSDDHPHVPPDGESL